MCGGTSTFGAGFAGPAGLTGGKLVNKTSSPTIETRLCVSDVPIHASTSFAASSSINIV